MPVGKRLPDGKPDFKTIGKVPVQLSDTEGVAKLNTGLVHSPLVNLKDVSRGQLNTIGRRVSKIVMRVVQRAMFPAESWAEITIFLVPTSLQ